MYLHAIESTLKASTFMYLLDMCSVIIIYSLHVNTKFHLIYATWLVHFSPLVLTVLIQDQVSPTQDDNTTAFVGVLIGGTVLGAVTVLLVVGIVCGVCKLRQHPKQPGLNNTPSK